MFFTGIIFLGGSISPPLDIPKLQLPHVHPNVPAHAPFTVKKDLQIQLLLKAAFVDNI